MVLLLHCTVPLFVNLLIVGGPQFILSFRSRCWMVHVQNREMSIQTPGYKYFATMAAKRAHGQMWRAH